MKFRVKIDEIKTAIESTGVVLSTNTQIQEVLKSFLIKVEDNNLMIQGTDLEIAMSIRTVCEMEESGEVLVDGKKLADIIRYSSGEYLEFHSTESKLEIKSSTGKWSLNIRSTEEFPVIEEFVETEPVSILNRQQFIQSLSKVLFAVCDDETRRALNAVMIKDNQFTSTDGKMIAVFTSPVKFDIDHEVVVPERALKPLLRVLKNFDEEAIQFQNSKSFYYFKIKSAVFSVRKVTIDFPLEKMKALVQKSKTENLVGVTFNKQELIGAIERARLSASQDSHGIHLNITKTSTTVKAADDFGNFSVEKVPSSLVSDTVDELSVFYNWLNLMDILKSFAGETVDCLFNEKPSKKPVFFGEQSLDAVLLPIEQSFNPKDFN